MAAVHISRAGLLCSNSDTLVTTLWAVCLQSGKTKFTIENATKTRVVLADTRVHILGSFQNIRVARWVFSPVTFKVMVHLSHTNIK